jgi:Flp pilus assembly protein TadB
MALVAAGRAAGLDALVELHRLGATARDMGQALIVELGDIGRELAVAVDATSRSGSPSADLFDEIGSLALAQSEIAHEVRVASAPARATVLIFVAAPTLYLAQRLSASGIAALVATPIQRSVTLVGLGLFVAGLVAVIVLARRVR